MVKSKTAAVPEETMDDNVDHNSSLIHYSEDISNASAPEPLPGANYPCSIKQVERQMSKSTGRPYLAVTVTISPEHFPANYDVDNAPDGVTLVYRRLSIEDSRRGRYRMRKFCECIGAPTSRDIDPTDWIGAECMVEVKQTEYEGELTNEIVRFIER